MTERSVPLASRLSEEDRAILRMIGSNLSRIIRDKPVDVTEVERNDELGILANLVQRVARELGRSRKRDRDQRAELTQKLEEIEQAHAQQEELLETIRELSSPVLAVAEGVLLAPLVGAMDAARAEHVMHRILERVAATRSPVVILDVTGVPAMDAEVATLLLRTARAVGLLGARSILCGVSPAVAEVAVTMGIDLSSLSPRGDLKDALAAAMLLVKRR